MLTEAISCLRHLESEPIIVREKKGSWPVARDSGEIIVPGCR